MNAIRDQLTRDPTLPPRPDFVAKLHGLAGTVERTVAAAKAKLEGEIHATAADLQAKAAAMKKPPAPPPAKEEFPQPWEDHQGLDATKLQGMVEALLPLGRARR